jgi:acyl-CoA synthetase (AMP-forming)/AMP-acid ligase II
MNTVDSHESLSGQAFLRLAAGAADWIDGLGLPTGAPLPALVTTNAIALALVLAGAATGHPLAPLGPRLTAAELAGPLRDMRASVLVTEPAFANVAGRVGVRTVDVTDIRPGADINRLAAPGPADVCVLLHTSGTTGAPKRVAMTQSALRGRTQVLAGLVGLDNPGRVYATGSPIHHIGGLGTVLVAMSAGATVVATQSFSVQWWRGLARLGVTHALLVPTMIEMLLAAGALDAVALRTLIYGASPIRLATLRQVLSVLAGVRVVNLFGQTEGSPIACLTAEDHRRAAAGESHLLGSVGRPAPGVDIMIDQPDPRGAGELLARAGHLFRTDADGWLHTGDIARQDDEGYLYLVGRTHDRIVRGGENVYPLEVEQVIETHPAVAAAGVVGVPDDRLGETIAAFVVAADPRRPPTADELRGHLRDRLAGFKVPVFWHLVPELPHNGAGKLWRRRLRDWHRSFPAPTESARSGR